MVDLCVVMPAYQAAELLPTSLPPLLESADGAPVLIVDPGSSDGTAEVAEKLGARVLRLGRRAGPAEARNAGVEEIPADVVLFIDSDCVVHPDVIEKVRKAFREDADLTSVTGSYDDTPPERNFASLYMNLRHHYVHQHARTENASFWAGCGAVRRDAFRTVGGFDAERYPRPMIEDIELGLRLKAFGKTRLNPELNVKHLKRWTVRSVITTDIFCRALPWSRLILQTGWMPDDLNLQVWQRIAAGWAPLFWLGLLALPIGLATGYAPALLMFWLGFVPAIVLNWGLLRFFAQRAGWLFAIGGFMFHQLHLSYSLFTYAFCKVEHLLKPKEASA